jgi:hypothetical protein
MDSGCELGCFGSVLLAEYRHAELGPSLDELVE